MTLGNATEQQTDTGAYALATSEEIDAVRVILSDNGHFAESTRVAYRGLEDPRRDAETVDRRFRVFLHDVLGAAPKDVVVSVTRGTVESAVELDTAVTGELPVLEEEFEVVEAASCHPPRMARGPGRPEPGGGKGPRGTASAGVFEYPEEKGRRILRGLAFYQDFPEDSAHGRIPWTDWWPMWTSPTRALTRSWILAWSPSRPSTATTPTLN